MMSQSAGMVVLQQRPKTLQQPGNTPQQQSNPLQHTVRPEAREYGHCNTLQHAATHCATLQHTAHTLQHTAETLQHSGATANTLQHIGAPHQQPFKPLFNDYRL